MQNWTQEDLDAYNARQARCPWCDGNDKNYRPIRVEGVVCMNNWHNKNAQRADEPKKKRCNLRSTRRSATKNKYRNQTFIRDGEKYRSEKEYRRHQELKALEKAGVIDGLRREVPYVLARSVVLNGRKKPPIRYYADFVYTGKNSIFENPTVEDTKSAITRINPVYRIKKHLMKAIHGIDILET